MKAFVFVNRRFPLRLTEVAIPAIKDNEVLLKIKASSINAADYRSMQMGIARKGQIMGADVAGVVEAVGKDVRAFSVGEEVCGDLADCGFGGFAEYVAAPQGVLAKKPASMPFTVAASVPLAGVTALQALRKGNIQPGQRVLIYGAGGGVGTFAVQLAKHFGAEVTAVCGQDNLKLMEELGADVVVDYNCQDITTSGQMFELVLGVNGCKSLAAYRRLLAAKGVFVLVGGALSQILKTLVLGKFMSLGGKKMRFLAAKPSVEDLAFILQLVETGAVRPVIDRIYTFDKTGDAVEHVRGGHARGKAVIELGA